jgi:CheY-like chemotaxis protein
MTDTSARAPLTGRALLVEDNAVVALDAEDMLRALGFADVDVASTTLRAMDLLRTHTYSAALVDLQLKDGPAARVLEAMVRMGLPFVIASGYAAGSESPAIHPGAPRIDKPYGEQDLAVALRAAQQHARGPRP